MLLIFKSGLWYYILVFNTEIRLSRKVPCNAFEKESFPTAERKTKAYTGSSLDRSFAEQQ